jgi:hypothetical protein
MHPVLNQYIDDLASMLELEDGEAKLFEYFCNYVITSKSYLGRFNPVDVTTQEDDASIDGITILIDGELILTVEDAEAAFESHKNNIPVEIIITQAKSGERFSKEKISNFNLGLQDLFSLDPMLPNGNYNKIAVDILNVIIANLKKVKNKLPDLKVNFCTSGVYTAEREIDAAFKIVETTCRNADLFGVIEVLPMGRGELMKLWRSITQKSETSLELINFMGINEMPGIPQAYITTVKAKEFIEKVAMDDEKNIREEVFDENVRAFLGAENTVNIDISKTLESDKSKQFAVLNNGVTIIAPELTLTPSKKTIHIANYQIINGCQTTNTLFNHYDLLNDSVELVVKFIQSIESDVAIDIVTATNNQSKVESSSFYALRDKARMVQKYFEIQRSVDGREQLYFERRESEYRNKPIKNTKVFDIIEMARCFLSVFKQKPHNAAMYVKKVLHENKDTCYLDTDNEVAYYVAAYICYKYNTLINGRKISSQKYNKLRWHVAMLYPWVVNKSVDTPAPNSGKMTRYCDKLMKTLTNDAYVVYFRECQDIIDSIPFPTDDQIKRGKYTSELKSAAEAYLNI